MYDSRGFFDLPTGAASLLVAAGISIVAIVGTTSGATAQNKKTQAAAEIKDNKAGVRPIKGTAAGNEREGEPAAANSKRAAGTNVGQKTIGKGWVLHQNTPYSPYSGSQTIVVSSKGMKMTAGDITAVILPPAYNIKAFNTDSMLMFEAPVAQWGKEMKQLKKGDKNNKLKMIGAGTICGIKAQRYVVLSPSGKSVIREISASKAITAPARISPFWAAVCGTPVEADLGVPLQVVRIYPEGRREILLDTLRIENVMLTASSLDKPTGCKPVKSAMELVLSAKELVGEESPGASR